MTELIVDAHACIEYLLGTPRGAVVRGYVEDPGNVIAVTAVTVAELLGWAGRNGGERAVRAVSTLIGQMNVIPVDEGIAREAGRLAASRDCSLADAFLYATAGDQGVKVLTADPRFRGAKEAIYVGP